jgi:hypothetical protein
MNLAAAAASAQQDIADDGNVVVKTNPITALGAGGRRMDDGFTLRDAVNADVEKTADAGPKDKREDFQMKQYGHTQLFRCGG